MTRNTVAAPGRPVSWYVEEQVQQGHWREEVIAPEIAGTTRPLTVFRAPLNKTTDRVRPALREPLPTQTADNGLALVSRFLLSLNHPNTRITLVGTQAFPTQTAYDDTALVAAPQGSPVGENEGCSIAEAAEQQAFVPQPGHADTAVVLPFIAELHGTSTARGITDALATVCAGGLHHGLVMPPPWLMTYYNHGRLAPVEEAAPTVTTLERHALVTANQEYPAGAIRVEDCGFRMLEWEEIRAAMAFPGDYRITGNRREKVRQLGNAVTPPVMELLMRRCLASLNP